jgi:glycosyltransferase involved in cell wall biosynthesis
MRLAFDARYLDGAASGIATYSENLLHELLKLDPNLELLLVARRPGVVTGLAHRFPQAEFDIRAREIVFPAAPRSFRTVYALPVILRRHRFSLYHSPFNIMPTGVQAKVVVTVHDIMQLQNPANISSSRFVQETAGRFWRVRTSHAIENADRILTVSASTGDAILERFPNLDASRIKITPNGVDPYFWATPTMGEVANVRLRLGTEAPFVLCVGNESPHKNHRRGVEAFMKAFADHPSMRMVLVRRSVRYDPRMVDLLAQPQIAKRIILLDHVLKSELRALYAEALLFFFPSWVEGFGLPILEAMASGTPVLTADRSAPGEIANGAALTASPFDIDAMAACLRQLSADDTLRKELIDRGRGRAKEYTWRRCAKSTLEAYRELVGN